MVTDLDKGGRIPQNVKTYLGPTTGWKYTDSPVDIEWTFEGGGQLIPVGVKPSIIIPDWLTISNCIIIAPVTGSVVFDIWKVPFDTYQDGTPPAVGDSICGAAKPTLTNGVFSEDTTLTGWTTTIDQNDFIAINIDSITTLTAITLILRCIRNIGPS